MTFNVTEKLAIHGGPPAVKTPIARRKRHGEAEKRLLEEVIDSDTLFYFTGTKVRQLEERFARLYGKKHCVACSSGTAALHIAVSSLQLHPGREVITSAITDMGTVTGVLYQGLIPVFADVDPETLNLDPASVRAAITAQTGAILAVHHSGLAADLNPLLKIAKDFSIPLIEDCAQAYGCEYEGELTGRRGAIGCFSLNHFKHISAGSGGMILTDDDHLRYIASLFLDKCYQREEGIRNPFFLAPNYQMTELQGAVALAQLDVLDEFVGKRRRLTEMLSSQLAQIEGISLQPIRPGSKHSYFLYLFQLDLERFHCTSGEFAQALVKEGVKATNGITGGRPVYFYDVFQHRSAFPGSLYPFKSNDTGADQRYPRGLCPVAEQAFDRWIAVEVLENYSEQNINEIAVAIAKAAYYFGDR